MTQQADHMVEQAQEVVTEIGAAAASLSKEPHSYQHTPIGPEVNHSGIYQLAWYTHAGDSKFLKIGDGNVNLSVFRPHTQNKARLSIDVRHMPGIKSNFDLELTPDQLISVAARLLDAAHDIKTNPLDKFSGEKAKAIQARGAA